MSDEHRQDPQPEDRLYQCEYDLENNSAPQQGADGAFATPYVCAVCGAGARKASNLCAPELNEGRGHSA